MFEVPKIASGTLEIQRKIYRRIQAQNIIEELLQSPLEVKEQAILQSLEEV